MEIPDKRFGPRGGGTIGKESGQNREHPRRDVITGALMQGKKIEMEADRSENLGSTRR